ncbi:MAG: succinylglutamate desuccinylase/aspartoacylase family protein [Gammaproteobacteria bacterium]|nr:succinylglutamate desuccinylase/aspartoacylase family protein [Gammaproteobacteria bacterium]MBL7000322.1 succinylglutamate desuccinylase/aspartoacylase family protein [Gammaproteobacteria bacterium]
MRAPFLLGGVSVKAGTQRMINLPLPGMYSDTPVTMAVHVFHGRSQGPTTFVSGAVHGDEINGIEIIRRLLSLKSLKRLKGTLIAVPVVNVFGFHNQSRYLPDRRDLNRCFPGQESGTMAGRLAGIFMREIVSHCEYGIDLHTAAIHRDNLPQIRADLTNSQLEKLSWEFAAPVLLHSAAPQGTLRFAGSESNCSIMVYEAGEALRFDEVSIRVGLRGVVNVLKSLQMLASGAQAVVKKHSSTLLQSTSWVRAAKSGIMRAQVGLGELVSKGQTLALISDPSGIQNVAITAPFSGVVIGRCNLPLVYEGEALFHIGKTRATSTLETSLELNMNDNDFAAPQLIEEPAII